MKNKIVLSLGIIILLSLFAFLILKNNEDKKISNDLSSINLGDTSEVVAEDKVIDIKENSKEIINKEVILDKVESVTPNTKVEEKIDSNKNNNMNKKHLVTIETDLGNMQFETYDADAPNTVKNFLTLTDKGYYNNIIFHRVIDGFMIQGGDPTGTGMGGPGYTFEDELNKDTDSYKEGYKTGVVAMANAGKNTNGSQFFIMVADVPLPKDYTIFGKLVSGIDVAKKISTAPRDIRNGDRPFNPVKMNKVSYILK